MTGLREGGGRRRQGPGRNALLGSISLHLLAVAGFWVAGLSHATPLPPLKSYRVDIVSPPPVEQGPALPEPSKEPEPTPPPPAPEPEPEPIPEPEPEPTPVKQPEPKPAPPEPKPKPKPEPKPEPKPQAKPTEPKPAPKPDTEKPTEAKPKPQPKPATGQKPDPDAKTSGSGLNVRIDGEQFPFPGYLEGIVVQIGRYFRWQGDTGLRAEIYFEILRDGSVRGIRLVTGSGNAAFNIEAMSAIEQAGLRRAFGPLPEEYTGDRLPVSFYFQPAR